MNVISDYILSNISSHETLVLCVVEPFRALLATLASRTFGFCPLHLYEMCYRPEYVLSAGEIITFGKR